LEVLGSREKKVNGIPGGEKPQRRPFREKGRGGRLPMTLLGVSPLDDYSSDSDQDQDQDQDQDPGARYYGRDSSSASGLSRSSSKKSGSRSPGSKPRLDPYLNEEIDLRSSMDRRLLLVEAFENETQDQDQVQVQDQDVEAFENETQVSQTGRDVCRSKSSKGSESKLDRYRVQDGPGFSMAEKCPIETQDQDQDQDQDQEGDVIEFEDLFGSLKDEEGHRIMEENISALQVHEAYNPNLTS